MPRGKSARQAQLEAENAQLRAQIEAQRSQLGAPGIREIEKKAKQSGTVTVACKIPQGLRLQLQHPMNRFIPTGRGGHDDLERVTFNVFGGPVYHVFGPGLPASVPKGYIAPKRIEGDYALTEGIPAAFWEQWLDQNKLADYVTNKMIFAFDDDSTVDAARDNAELKSGLEPLSQEMDAKGRLTDRRVPKPLNGAVDRISYDQERTSQQKSAAASAE